MEHLIIAPILIPAFAGMLLLLEVRERQNLRRLRVTGHTGVDSGGAGALAAGRRR